LVSWNFRGALRVVDEVSRKVKLPYGPSLHRNEQPVDRANEEGRTPLHFAAIHGCGDMVSALLAEGPVAKAKDSSGKT
jgi:ankyrin repeat protein